MPTATAHPSQPALTIVGVLLAGHPISMGPHVVKAYTLRGRDITNGNSEECQWVKKSLVVEWLGLSGKY